jgi:hypothetical protein
VRRIFTIRIGAKTGFGRDAADRAVARYFLGRTAGLEQDERHSRRGQRGHRHPAAPGYRPARVHRHASADRERHRRPFHEDRPTYRKLGIITYGFDPFKLDAADLQSGMHGNDEHICIANIGFGLRYTYDILRYVQ